MIRRTVYLWVALCTAGAAFADAVKLDSGKTIEGTVVGENAAGVQISVGGAVVTVPRSKVVSIAKTTGAIAATTATVSVEQLQDLETKGNWPDLYEAATALLARDSSHTVAAEKQKQAAAKIRESLGGPQIANLVRARKFDDAITTLTERLRASGLSSRRAGAVGRRVLAELYLGRAELRFRQSVEGHGPLADVRKARELDPTTPGVDYLEAVAQMRLRNFDQALPLLERAARSDPNNFAVLAQLMQCYRAKGDHARVAMLYASASKEADAAASSWPELRATLAEAFLQIAGQMAREGKGAQAGAVYEKYLNFVDPTPDQLRAAAEFYDRIGDRPRAQAIRNQTPPSRNEMKRGDRER